MLEGLLQRVRGIGKILDMVICETIGIIFGDLVKGLSLPMVTVTNDGLVILKIC